MKNNAREIDYTSPIPGGTDECRHLDYRKVDLRGYVPFPRLKQEFDIAYSDDFLAKERNPDKVQLLATVLGLRVQGMSYREIAQEVGLHWTRIQQIVKGSAQSSERLD